MPDNSQENDNEDKRIHKRVEFFSKVKIVIPEDKIAIDVFASNVSKGGMFLRSNCPLQNGKKVSLEFELEEDHVTVDVGEVVWSKPFEPISVDGDPAGMGVEFKSMSNEARTRIESFIDDILVEPENSATQTESQKQTTQPDAQSNKMKIEIPIPESDPVQASEPDRPMPADGKPPPAETPEAKGPGEMANLSLPPPPKKRALLFGGFVLLVAVVTFVVLLVLKPIEGAGGKKADNLTEPKPAKEAGPTSPDTGKKPEAKPEAKPETKPDLTGDSAIKLEVGLPVFTHSDNEWKMVLRATASTKIKSFTLKDPPRLAIDFKDASYSGKRRVLDSPTPFITKLRIGTQEKFTRFVLDFSGAKIPKHKIIKGKDSVTITFTN